MLEVCHLHLRAGLFELEDVNLDVAAGECVALMGPSGCGKTTILETICGLRQPAGGTIQRSPRVKACHRYGNSLKGCMVLMPCCSMASTAAAESRRQAR